LDYRVEPAVFEKYPDLKIGVVCGTGLVVARSNEKLTDTIAQNIRSFLAKYTPDNLLQHPNIAAWRETYRSFGVKPKRYKPTAEALLRRVLSGEPFPRINTAVDSYLAVELIHLLPIGGYDRDKIDGEIVLRISPGGEEFHPIGAREAEITREGEMIYADNSAVLTRKWNFRDADHSKITEQTASIVLATEAASASITDDDVRGTVDLIVKYEQEFCGGTYQCHYLSAENPRADI
jgi:DNA/RNA-binding domain of Phe-tRNA-synthetase-like protein